MSKDFRDMEIDSPEMERLMDDIWQQMLEEQQRWEALSAREKDATRMQLWNALSGSAPLSGLEAWLVKGEKK